MAEEQPGLALGLGRHAFLKKRAERRHSGARPDHDDGRVAIGRQGKIMGALDISFNFVAWPQDRTGEGRSDAKPSRPSIA